MHSLLFWFITVSVVSYIGVVVTPYYISNSITNHGLLLMKVCPVPLLQHKNRNIDDVSSYASYNNDEIEEEVFIDPIDCRSEWIVIHIVRAFLWRSKSSTSYLTSTSEVVLRHTFRAIVCGVEEFSMLFFSSICYLPRHMHVTLRELQHVAEGGLWKYVLADVMLLWVLSTILNILLWIVSFPIVMIHFIHRRFITGHDEAESERAFHVFWSRVQRVCTDFVPVGLNVAPYDGRSLWSKLWARRSNQHHLTPAKIVVSEARKLFDSSKKRSFQYRMKVLKQRVRKLFIVTALCMVAVRVVITRLCVMAAEARQYRFEMAVKQAIESGVKL